MVPLTRIMVFKMPVIIPLIASLLPLQPAACLTVSGTFAVQTSSACTVLIGISVLNPNIMARMMAVLVKSLVFIWSFD